MKLKKQDSKLLKSALGSMPKPIHPKKHVKSVPKSSVNPEASSHGLESILAQRLASNDPLMRNKTMKKVRKWIKQRSEAEDDSEAFTEVEMMRLWKGLFYCYWMSDKPLVQEELAESISKLIECFGSNTSSALLFVASFMSTIGREWVGIDRWRMDKFMMLVRRFLRQCFLLLERNNWDTETVAKWNEIVTSRTVSVNTLLGRPMKRKKHKKALNGQPDSEKVEKPKVFQKVALGYQLHFTDVFLEELAKVGTENLNPTAIQALLRPFILELTIGLNDLLCKHVEERIFKYLMRQSDSGIAFEDMLDGNDEESNHEENDSNLNNSDGEEDNDSDLKSDESGEEDHDEKDPRAGGVSVVLPQIRPDFTQLAEDLFEAGSGKDVQIQKRARLYKLSKQFKDLGAGTYPLAAGFEKDPDSIPKIKSKKVAKRTLQKETKRIAESREERKRYKQLMKQKSKKGNVESDQTSKKIKENDKEEEAAALDDEQEDTLVPDDHVAETPDEDSLVLNISSQKKMKKRRKKDQDEEKVVVVKKKKKINSNEGCVTPDSRPAESQFITRSLPASRKSSSNKRINFSLMENKCSSLQDIDKSISESPQIPYDASKRPKQGVLKKTVSQTSSPSSPQVLELVSGRQNVAYNTMLNGKSKFGNRFMSTQFILR